MDNNLYVGKLVRLVAFDPERQAELIAKWSHDAEFLQLWDSDAATPRSKKQAQAQIDEYAARPERPGWFRFFVQPLDGDTIIGEVAIWNTYAQNHDGWVSIGIWEREYWGKGYGTDAMRLLLAFGFRELDLHRISLGTFGYNPRAIRSYEKVGFKHEGVLRRALQRYGKRWDDVFMGILRTEWEQGQHG